MNSLDLFKEIVDALKNLYPINEAREFAFILLEHLFTTSKTQVLANKKVSVSEPDRALLQHYILRLKDQEPIQYITGETYFLGERFEVSPDVLIPRSETEELVLLCQKKLNGISFPTVIDFCTGSGCIAISIKNLVPQSEIIGVDISEKALAMAQRNANLHQAPVVWKHIDVLAEKIVLPVADLIVSNPPYVLDLEKQSMDRNVLDYEPHLALFVPDHDPLLFYQKIVAHSHTLLKPEGWLAFEINERFGTEVADLFKDAFTSIEVVKDIHGKDRFVIGQKTERVPS